MRTLSAIVYPTTRPEIISNKVLFTIIYSNVKLDSLWELRNKVFCIQELVKYYKPLKGGGLYVDNAGFSIGLLFSASSLKNIKLLLTLEIIGL